MNKKLAPKCCVCGKPSMKIILGFWYCKKHIIIGENLLKKWEKVIDNERKT